MCTTRLESIVQSHGPASTDASEDLSASCRTPASDGGGKLNEPPSGLQAQAEVMQLRSGRVPS
jgi:hypothetical protein